MDPLGFAAIALSGVTFVPAVVVGGLLHEGRRGAWTHPVVVLATAVLILVSLVLSGVSGVAGIAEHQAWPAARRQVDGRVLEATVGRDREGDECVRVHYTYDVGGVTYSGDARVYAGSDAPLPSYAPEGPVTVHYDGGAPSRSVLDPRNRPTGSGQKLFAAMFFFMNLIWVWHVGGALHAARWHVGGGGALHDASSRKTTWARAGEPGAVQPASGLRLPGRGDASSRQTPSAATGEPGAAQPASGLRCPLCRDRLDASTASACPACGTRYHAACLEELGGCSVRGCQGASR